MAILVLTVLLDDTQSLFERRAPAAFSQLIYGLADVATLSGSPPVAPTCKPVQCDALSILPYVGAESLRQSRLNYIIVEALPLPPPPDCLQNVPKKHHPHTHQLPGGLLIQGQLHWVEIRGGEKTAALPR